MSATRSRTTPRPAIAQRLHLVYVSELSGAADHTVFPQVAAVARERNARIGIGGALLFDGQRFCHWMHGEAPAVQRLFAKVAADPRHQHLSVRLKALRPASGGAGTWNVGFVDAEAIDAFERLDPADADAVYDALVRMVALADLQPRLDVTRSTGAPPRNDDGGA